MSFRIKTVVSLCVITVLLAFPWTALAQSYTLDDSRGIPGRRVVDGTGTARDQFIDRYGLQVPEERPPLDYSARPEQIAKFDENGAHSSYPYARSVAAMRDLFLDRACQLPESPHNPLDVAREIDDTFGVSRLGAGIEVLERTAFARASSGGIDRISFRFGDAGFGQALVGVPTQPNGVVLTALHGCWLTPDEVMSDVNSYANAFGLRAMESGYTVIAPYVTSGCAWIHNLDWIGGISGVSVFGYELARIGELTRWAKGQYVASRAAVWGISLGGQFSMLAAALFRDLFDAAVISGAAGDYEESYRQTFNRTGVDGERRLPVNTQSLLSARVARRDVVASILPRPIVFEISTSDLNPGAMAMISYIEQAAARSGALPPRVLLFEGSHETYPRKTLRLLDEVMGIKGGVPKPAVSSMAEPE